MARKKVKLDLEPIDIDSPEGDVHALGIPLLDGKDVSKGYGASSASHANDDDGGTNKPSTAEPRSHKRVSARNRKITVRLDPSLERKMAKLMSMATMLREGNRVLNRLLEAGFQAIGTNLENELRDEMNRYLSRIKLGNR